MGALNDNRLYDEATGPPAPKVHRSDTEWLDPTFNTYVMQESERAWQEVLR